MTLQTFKNFIADEEAAEMYITGGAGTGKTTSLGEITGYCVEKAMGHVACAYTHKACAVLASKLPPKVNISTLHSFLTKRPTINTYATKVKHVDSNTLTGEAQLVQVLFVDEFSMVGAQDYEDIRKIQYDAKGNLITKVVFIGDMNQLPPVGDAQDIEPNGDYVVYLTKVYRQENDNQLLDTLIALQSYIQGAPAKPLAEHATFLRGRDIVQEYKKNPGAVILAYTNERVQLLNAKIEGKKMPDIGDAVYSPTVRRNGAFVNLTHNPKSVKPILGETIDSTTKYNPLKTLKSLVGVDFMTIEEEIDGHNLPIPRAVVFGHKNYRDAQLRLKTEAVKANKQVMRMATDWRFWLQQNPTHPLTKARAKAWREQLTFNACVICLDFRHAMTVHKSQGSTYDTVLVDMQDLGRCSERNYQMYLRLMYVAISRASNMVITN